MVPRTVKAAFPIPEQDGTPSSEDDSADDSAEHVEGLIRVEVAPTIADAALYPGWIHNRNPEIAKDFPEAHGHEQWISIVLEGQTYDYRLRVTAMRDGEPVGAVGEMIACECNNAKLMGLVDDGIAAAMEQLRLSSVEMVSMSASSKPDVELQLINGDILLPEHRSRRRLGPLGYAGIGLGVAGLGALATGIPLYLRAPRGAINRGRYEYISTKPPGIALAAIGSAALTVGIVLTAVDVVRHRRRVARISPMWNERVAGFSLAWEFEAMVPH